MEIRYGVPSELNNTISASIPATLTTTEADLFVVKDSKYLMYSKFTVMASVTLGVVTSATFYYYVSNDGGTTWFPLSLISASTGDATQRTAIVTSGTYALSGTSYFEDEITVSAALAFKVTGLCSSGTPAYTLWVGGRND